MAGNSPEHPEVAVGADILLPNENRFDYLRLRSRLLAWKPPVLGLSRPAGAGPDPIPQNCKERNG